MKKTHCFLWFCFLLVTLVPIDFGSFNGSRFFRWTLIDGSWFFRWKSVFPLDVDCLIYFFNFLTAVSAKAAEFSTIRKSDMTNGWSLILI